MKLFTLIAASGVCSAGGGFYFLPVNVNQRFDDSIVKLHAPFKIGRMGSVALIVTRYFLPNLRLYFLWWGLKHFEKGVFV